MRNNTLPSQTFPNVNFLAAELKFTSFPLSVPAKCPSHHFQNCPIGRSSTWISKPQLSQHVLLSVQLVRRNINEGRFWGCVWPFPPKPFLGKSDNDEETSKLLLPTFFFNINKYCLEEGQKRTTLVSAFLVSAPVTSPDD